jgi:diguanylate cyclase (GGDEF)-like protein/prepilin-type processing-associated H-X9-DG protein
VRPLSLSALVLSIALLLVSVGVAVNDHNRHQAAAQRAMDDEAGTHGSTLDASMARARTITLIMAHNAAFRGFYQQPGSRAAKLRPGSTYVDGANDALVYLESLFPRQIGELCFIDRSGSENARVVHGQRAPVSDLSPDEASNPFFGPTFALRPGQVFQSEPYVSPDTHDWVVGNATPIPLGPQYRSVAIVHYELSVESFRAQLRSDDHDYGLHLVDARTGRVVVDSSRPQKAGAPLGVPGDRRFAALARHSGARGMTMIDGHVAAYRHLGTGNGNANDWILVAVATDRAPGILGAVGVASLAILAVALVLMTLAVFSLRAARRELETAAASDVLTGLPNRRQLMTDLENRAARPADPAMLLLFDLDGFKNYNDSFGHLAGDALLARLGQALERSVQPYGRAYRLGGDEFCVLAEASARAEVERLAPAALTEHGDGFAVTTSYGAVVFPGEAASSNEALLIADQRMYEDKNSGRATARRQSTDVLLRALAERHPSLEGHLGGVAHLAEAVGRHLGLEGEALDHVRVAAELHDVGKVAIPDAILNKPGPLDDEEWAFMRRHTLIGERIVAAAPALGTVAKLVRASHERWDGDGYPDRTAGADIPLGARIVAVCDAYDAIVADRAYRRGRSPAEAMEELERCAGAQFDPAVVAAFAAVLAAEGCADAAAAA